MDVAAGWLLRRLGRFPLFTMHLKHSLIENFHLSPTEHRVSNNI